MATKDPNKVDLKLDPGLREQVEAIALERFGAKEHHISKRPEITGALNKLVKLGIAALESGYLDNNPDAIHIPPSPDLEAVVREQVNMAIAAMPKPEAIEPNLEELAGAVVALLTEDEKKP